MMEPSPRRLSSDHPKPAGRDRTAHDPTRRAFLGRAAAAGVGLGLGAPALASPLGAADVARCAARRDAPAKGVIQIFLSGGLSHIDTFDPKPGAPVEVRGEFDAIATALDGAQFSELLPRTAAIADRLCLLRATTHGEAAHERGTHNMLTGYRPSPAIVYPSMGSVVAHELGTRNNLPAYVGIPAANRAYGGAGYLSSAFAPFSLGDNPAGRNFRVRDLNPPKGVDAARQERRRLLLHDLDASFPRLGHADPVEATDAFYEQAYALMDSPEARGAFDLTKEDDKTRKHYGTTGLGPALLLARRLIAAGVRYVTVTAGGWDNHSGIFPALRRSVPFVDRGFAALIEDLERTGLLDETVVLLTSEFGRTSRVNGDAGRDHWAKVFTTVAAGGGLARGCIHGASNADGAEPEHDAVTPPDLAATVFTLMGIDPTKKLMAPGDRPIDIVRDGRVLTEILA